MSNIRNQFLTNSGIKIRRGFFMLEAASGFEPLHKGFADLSLSHLGTPPLIIVISE